MIASSIIAARYTATFNTNRNGLELTVEFLSGWYELDHEVIIYEAAFFPGEPPGIERITLKQLPDAELNSSSTLAIMPKSGLN